MKTKRIFLLFVLFALVFNACKKEEITPGEEDNLFLAVPDFPLS